MPLSGSGPLFPCPVLLGRSEDRSFAAIAAVSAQQPSPAHSSSVAIPISGGFSAGAREASSSSSACLNCAQVNWCFLQHSTAVLGVHICTPAHPRSSCTGATLEVRFKIHHAFVGCHLRLCRMFGVFDFVLLAIADVTGECGAMG